MLLYLIDQNVKILHNHRVHLDTFYKVHSIPLCMNTFQKFQRYFVVLEQEDVLSYEIISETRKQKIMIWSNLNERH